MSAYAGKLYIFKDARLVEYMDLKLTDSVRYFDTSCARWITHLSNSPFIRVTEGCTIHIKRPNVKVDTKALTEAGRYVRKEDTGSQLERENAKTDRLPDTSEIKKTAKSRNSVIDLTFDEPAEKRFKGDKPQPPSSPSKVNQYTSSIKMVGEAPARLSKFPARSVADMISRMEYIGNAEKGGTVVSRYNAVFSSKFYSTTFYRHQRYWRLLVDRGLLSTVSLDDDWKTIVSLVSTKEEDGSETFDRHTTSSHTAVSSNRINVNIPSSNGSLSPSSPPVERDDPSTIREPSIEL